MEIGYGHPLYGAELRLARTRQLIGTLDRQYRRFADLHNDPTFDTVYDVSTNHLQITPRLADARTKHIPRISLTLGEVVYNVRSALDFLVYSIACANNGGIELDGTQFPLEDDPSAYWMRWTGRNAKGKPINPNSHWLKNIPKEVADDLEHYQPYSCGWTEIVRDVSNRDKHRHLSTLTVTLGFRPSGPPVGVVDPVEKKQSFVFPGGGIEVGIYLPDGGQDILDAAHLIQREARALIRSYARIFKLPPPGLIENEFPTQAPSGA